MRLANKKRRMLLANKRNALSQQEKNNALSLGNGALKAIIVRVSSKQSSNESRLDQKRKDKMSLFERKVMFLLSPREKDRIWILSWICGSKRVSRAKGIKYRVGK